MKPYFQAVDKTVSAKKTRQTPESDEIDDETECDVTEDATTTTPPEKAKAKTYKYNVEWEKEYSWLKYDSDRNVMFCLYCQKAPVKIRKDNPCMVGNKILKKDNVQKHNTSHHHLPARDAFLAKKDPERAGTVRHSITNGITRANDYYIYK